MATSPGNSPARSICSTWPTWRNRSDPDLLKKITSKANAVEQQFNNYRAKVDGKEMTDSEVRNVLKNSTDSEVRRKVWDASKGVGATVEGDLKDLVLLRNDAAKKLGFANFHAMTLTLNEQDGGELIKLFDDLNTLTKEPFTKAKADIDARLSKKSGVGAARADAVALPRSVLPGISLGVRCEPRHPLRQSRHYQTLRGLLQGDWPPHRRRDRPE